MNLQLAGAPKWRLNKVPDRFTSRELVPEDGTEEEVVVGESANQYSKISENQKLRKA